MHCRKQDRMRIIATLVTLGVAVGSPLAIAEEKPKASMGAPVPPPELAKFNSMMGTWKCVSKMHLPPEMGGEQTGKTTMIIKKDMNGYWMVGQWKMEKTKTMPEMKGAIYWGYDPVEKKFVELGVDSTGSMMRGTSDGPQSGKWVWDEDGTMMGKKSKTRTTVTEKSPTVTEVRTEIETEPGKWAPMGEDDCKKQPGGRA